MDKYKNKPDIRLVATGQFYEKTNFIDINNDGYPDILIVDFPNKPKSLEEAVSMIFNRQVTVSLKFYLYNNGAKGYPSAPSFVTTIHVDLLKDFVCEDSIMVQSVLDEWEPFLHKQKVDGCTRYSIYHSSFKEFLNRKEIVRTGTTKESINRLIAGYLWQSMEE